MEQAQASPDLTSLVRDGDYARFLAIQVAPRAARDALYALTAVAIELRRVPTVTSEPITAMLRYTWWRESLETIAAGNMPGQHPVLEAMAALYAASPTAFHAALAMVAAQQEALEADETADLQPTLDAGWIHVLGEADGVKLLKIHGWLAGLDPQRLHRPATIARLLWKALKTG